MNERLQPTPLIPDPTVVARRNVASLVRAVIALAIGKLENRGDEGRILKQKWPDDQIAPLILRAATAPATITNTPALAATIVADVIATIGPQSAGAKLLRSGLQLTFDRYATISVPSVQAQLRKPRSLVRACRRQFIISPRQRPRWCPEKSGLALF